MELRAKLSGLLVEKVEVVTVDLSGALDEARRRVWPLMQVTQTPDAPARLPNGGTVTDEFDNQGPGKKGDPTADPE